MAGLLAARVLADVYPEVVVVERDELPEGPAHRRGVPRGRHVHGLLARGVQALEELCPGVVDELTGRGVPAGDMLGNTLLHFGGHRFRPGPSGLTVLGASRPALEACLRSRVRRLPAVTVLDRCVVEGLAATPDERRVHGARVIRQQDGGSEETLAADLVVDTTGRGSRTPAWLHDLGCAVPPVDETRVGVGYASCTYRLTPEALGGTVAILTAPTPGRPRGGALSAMEDGRFILTLFGLAGDRPPDRPLRLHRLRCQPAVPRHPPGRPRRRTPRRAGGLPLPRERAAPVRAVAHLPRGTAGHGGRGRDLQPHLRPGDDRGRPAGPRSPPSPPARSPAPGATVLPGRRRDRRRRLGSRHRRRSGVSPDPRPAHRPDADDQPVRCRGPGRRRPRPGRRTRLPSG
ncbi:FAD-dependent oxidoreductase [Geodermatophilus sp. SYSU D01186]